VFAFETSWEATPGKLTADQVRTGAWGSVMGGAFYLYAECFEPTLTWGDGQAFRFVEIMHDFLASLRYWELKPDPALVSQGSLCLANPGVEYVIYRQDGAPIVIDCSKAQPGTTFKAEWLNTRTGAKTTSGTVAAARQLSFNCPDPNDWVLH